jgi:hypothetical protein
VWVRATVPEPRLARATESFSIPECSHSSCHANDTAQLAAGDALAGYCRAGIFADTWPLAEFSSAGSDDSPDRLNGRRRPSPPVRSRYAIFMLKGLRFRFSFRRFLLDHPEGPPCR